MAQRRRLKKATPGCRASIALAIDVAKTVSGELTEAPTEFRIFKAGINKSEKGSFLFDALSAESVMREYLGHGKPMLMDFNHGTTFWEPTPEQAISAGEFVPVVRDGELWATDIKWTDRAKQLIEAREYRLFSPYFEHEIETSRIIRLINVALTNLPALDNIEPLLAASANSHEGEAMEWERLFKELQVKHEALQKETEQLRAKLSGLETAEPDKADAVGLRAQVYKLTGKASAPEAMGHLEALRVAHEKLTKLTAELEAERATKLSKEWTTALDAAVAGNKVGPAQKPFWEGIAKEDGHAKALARLGSFLETAPDQVKTAATAATAPATSGARLSASRMEIARQTGTKVEDIEKWEADQAKQSAAR